MTEDLAAETSMMPTDARTATLTGTRYMVRVKKSEPLEVGNYLVFEDEAEEFERTTAPCPYCRRRLHKLTERAFRRMSRISRVLQILGPIEADGRQPVLADPLPRGYRVLSCFQCKVEFSAPLKQLRANR
jgi:hypothetical protein